MPGICWWYLFHKLMKSSFSTAHDIFKPLLKCSIFNCISWLNGSFFGGEHRGILKEVVKTYRMAPVSPLNSPTFFRMHISLCNDQGLTFSTNRERLEIILHRPPDAPLGTVGVTRRLGLRTTRVQGTTSRSFRRGWLGRTRSSLPSRHSVRRGRGLVLGFALRPLALPTPRGSWLRRVALPRPSPPLLPQRGLSGQVGLVHDLFVLGRSRRRLFELLREEHASVFLLRLERRAPCPRSLAARRAEPLLPLLLHRLGVLAPQLDALEVEPVFALVALDHGARAGNLAADAPNFVRVVVVLGRRVPFVVHLAAVVLRPLLLRVFVTVI